MTEEVFVVGGGTSLEGFDFGALRGRDVIVVNKSLNDVPFAKYFITMDFTFLRKIGRDKVQASSATKVFIQNMVPEYMVEKDGRVVDERFNLIYDLSDFDVIVKSRKTEGVGLEVKDFRHGMNSGYCGLQLAAVLGYKKIYLLGLDYVIGKDGTHYHGGYGEVPEKFSAKLIKYRELALVGVVLLTKLGVQVVSCSQVSTLNAVIPYRDVMEVLNENGSIVK